MTLRKEKLCTDEIRERWITSSQRKEHEAVGALAIQLRPCTSPLAWFNIANEGAPKRQKYVFGAPQKPDSPSLFSAARVLYRS